MARYAALLRGVNVGGRNKVAMADLRILLGDLGFTGVKTLLQSGNAIVDAGTEDRAAVSARIAAALTERYERVIGIVLVTRADLDRVVAGEPFGEVATNPSRLLVTFLSGPPDPALFAADDPADYAPDRYVLGEREIYTWMPGLGGDTKLTPQFWAKRLPGLVATARNWNTVLKLRDLL
ncbi:MAG: DUF1697 domain-containing protein [Hamadaea sp.]|nr:DUF1697 domain-containing protein [Hamadaea sp.]